MAVKVASNGGEAMKVLRQWMSDYLGISKKALIRDFVIESTAGGFPFAKVETFVADEIIIKDKNDGE